MNVTRAAGSLVLFLAAAACTQPNAADDGVPAESALVADTPHGMVGGHGMTLFGGPDKLYLSHIPLFDGAHAKQVVVEVAITGGVAADGLAQFGGNQFTVSPSATWSLVDFSQGLISTISGDIYFGDFEAPGHRLLYPHVTFAVRRVVFTQPLSHTMTASAKPEYIALGTPNRPFLVHVIDRAPSFDSVLAIKLGPETSLTAEQLEAGQRITLDGSNAEATRIVGGALSADIAESTEIACLPGDQFFGSCRASTGTASWTANDAGTDAATESDAGEDATTESDAGADAAAIRGR